MRQVALVLALVLGLALPASAQISVPNTFVANTRIVSADVNANFAELGSKSLNREGGTATGDIVFATRIVPDTNGGADIGTALLQFGTIHTQGLIAYQGLNAPTLVLSDTGPQSIDTAGGITAGSGNVDIVGADGRIPALSSTYIANLSGASLTGILETNIADGAVLARVASAETITAQWTFSPSGGATLWNASSATSNAFAIRGRSSDDQGQIFFLNNTGGTNFGAIRGGTGSAITILAGTTPDVVATFTSGATTLTGRLNSASAQPGFLVTRTSGTPVTGAVNNDTVIWESEVYDTGNNFAAGVFTAPATGIYEFCFNGSAHATGSAVAGFKFVVNGVSYVLERDHSAANQYSHYGSCIHVPLTATQTATMQVYEVSSETIEYGYTARDIWFSGRLVP